MFGLLLTLMASYIFLAENAVTAYIKQRIDNMAYDFQVRFLFPQSLKKNNPVVIVDIDERSVQTYGRWPWSRELMAKLTDALYAQGAVVLAFDILFLEKEKTVTDALRQGLVKQSVLNDDWQTKLRLIEPWFKPDALFAKSLAGKDNVLGFTFRLQGEHSGLLAKPLLELNAKQKGRVMGLPFRAYSAPIATLTKASKTTGFVTTSVDNDGLLRRVPLVIPYGEAVYGSLALEAVKLYFLEETVGIELYQQEDDWLIEGVTLGKQFIPTDSLGQVLVPYFGDRGAHAYFSASDVMQGRVPAGALENKVVFIGSTLLGLADLQATPVNPVYPGLEVQASIASGIIQQFIPQTPYVAAGLSFSVFLASALFASVFLPLLPLLSMSVLALLLMALLISWQLYLWLYYGYFISLVFAILAVAVIALANLFYGYFIEGREAKRIRGLFAEYVPPDYAALLTDEESIAGFDGESREISVLFMDVVGFTTLSESLQAHEIKQLLNYYLTPLTEAIFTHQGTIDKYIGDAIMAFWGAPKQDFEHRLHACLGALAMLETVEAYNQREDRPKHLPTIAIKMGLNAGIANVGDMGSHYRRAYTAIGDVVNTAARMEAATRQYGVDLMVAEPMVKGLEEVLAFSPLDKVVFKGKTEPVVVYELVGVLEQLTAPQADELSLRQLAFEYYYQRAFNRAEQLFLNLANKYPKKRVYPLYLSRIQAHRDNPPADDWQGVEVLLEK